MPATAEAPEQVETPAITPASPAVAFDDDAYLDEPALRPDPKAAPPAAPAVPKHLARMLERSGLDPEEFAGAPEADVWKAISLERERAADERFLNTTSPPPRAAEPPAPPQQQPAERPVAAPREQPPAAAGPDLDADTLDELESAPGVARLLKQLLADNAALKAQVGEFGQREQRREVMTFQQRLDAQYARHPAVFGDAEAAPHRKAAVMTYLRGLHDQKKQTTPEQDVDAAVRVLFGGTPAPAARPAAGNPGAGTDAPPAPAPRPRDPQTGQFLSPADAEYARQWGESGLARPTDRATPAEPPGVRKAEKYVESWLQRVGATTDPGAPDSDEATLR